MSLTWSVPDVTTLHIQLWGDHAIVFHSLSGETHCLNGLAIEVLTRLKVAPATHASLTKQICMTFEVDDKAVLEQKITRVLTEFDSLGLIESLARES